jgi:hypothetical protein
MTTDMRMATRYWWLLAFKSADPSDDWAMMFSFYSVAVQGIVS